MMRWILLCGALVVGLAAGCNVFLPSVGGAGQPCKPDLTCNPGLACLQNRCVTMNDGGDGGPDGFSDGDGGATDAEPDGGDAGPDGGDGAGCVQPDDCDDDNLCTDDECNNGQCVHTANSFDCDDGETCTEHDKCLAGECHGRPKDSDNDSFVDALCNGTDCDDNEFTINPGAVEGPAGSSACNDGKDNNCDGKRDDEDVGCRACSSSPECDDLVYCNGPEKCDNNSCIRGQAPCDDRLVCTVDQCHENTQQCEHGIQSGTCLIEGGCYQHGETMPGNVCFVCLASSPNMWAFNEGAVCDDKIPCTENDRCSKGMCAGTAIDRDSDGYGLAPCGDDCDDNNIQVNPGAVEGPVGDVTCVDQLDNDCDNLTDQNDPGCKCSIDDQCSDHNRCNGQEMCLDGRCISASPSPCNTGADCLDCNELSCPISAGNCLIRNVCYGDGAHQPGNDCNTCVPSQDQEHWTSTCK